MFFYFISLAMLLTVVLQFNVVGEIDDDRVTVAPILSGTSLLLSFVFNAIWVRVRSDKKTLVERFALLLWTISITVGVAAAGATLGQMAVYEDLGISKPENMEALQWISLALLVASVSLPHYYKKKKKTAASASVEGRPETEEKTPLIFV